MEQTAVPAFKSIGEVVTEIKKDLGLFKEETEETTESLGKLDDEMDDTTTSTNKGTKALTEYQKAMQRVNAISDKRAAIKTAFNVNLDTSGLEDFESTMETEADKYDEEFEMPESYDPTTGMADEDFINRTIRMKAAAEDLAGAINQLMRDMAISTIVGMSEIVGAMAVGEASLKDLGNFVVGQFASMLQQLGKLFIEYGVGLLAFQTATFTMNPGLAIAAGAALVALGAGIKAHMNAMAEGSIPALAEGGIVTGPTLALIGEGRESEAVIPLSKLNTMMQGGGNGAVEVYGRLSGQDILLSSEKATRTRSRYRGF